MEKLNVQIVNNSTNENPIYSTSQSAGADLRAWVGSNDHLFVHASAKGTDREGNKVIHLMPNGRCKVDTGLHISLPEGYEAQIRPRSGLSLKQGMVAILGTIDADYRGSIGIIVHNISDEVLTIHEGDRIAQLVISKVSQAEFTPVDSLDETERGEGGFGSTSIK